MDRCIQISICRFDVVIKPIIVVVVELNIQMIDVRVYPGYIAI